MFNSKRLIISLVLSLFTAPAFAATWSAGASTIPSKPGAEFTFSVPIMRDGVQNHVFTANAHGSDEANALILAHLKQYADVESADNTKIGGITYTPPLIPQMPTAEQIAQDDFLKEFRVLAGMSVLVKEGRMNSSQKEYTDQLALVNAKVPDNLLKTYAPMLAGFGQAF